MCQFKKLEQDLRARGEIKWKHAMHLMRLLLSGISALREGELRVRLDEERDALLTIKRGERPGPKSTPGACACTKNSTRRLPRPDCPNARITPGPMSFC